jgi:eukaryotic-like serine/threonine-protein kinase
MTPASTRFDHPRDLLLEQRPLARKHYELKIGSVLGRFRVLQEIGRGGHGVVYQATDTGLGRDVALKTVVTPHNDQPAAEPAATEAELLCRVHDQHVVGIFDLIPLGDANVLVLELVHGPALDTVARTERLSAKEVSALGIQLGEGLEALHRAGIVHGDLKPANLRLSASGVLKILDLGVARLLPDVRPEKRTPASSQVVVGTVPYMSPEQLRGSAGDIRSDIWSAGTVLFELATGQRAFGKLTTTSRLSRILNGIVPPPRQINPDVPASLERVILRALNPDPDHRFQSARELIRGLYDAMLENAGRSSRRRRPMESVGVFAERAPDNVH